MDRGVAAKFDILRFWMILEGESRRNVVVKSEYAISNSNPLKIRVEVARLDLKKIEINTYFCGGQGRRM